MNAISLKFWSLFLSVKYIPVQEAILFLKDLVKRYPEYHFIQVLELCVQNKLYQFRSQFMS